MTGQDWLVVVIAASFLVAPTEYLLLRVLGHRFPERFPSLAPRSGRVRITTDELFQALKAQQERCAEIGDREAVVTVAGFNAGEEVVDVRGDGEVVPDLVGVLGKCRRFLISVVHSLAPSSVAPVDRSVGPAASVSPVADAAVSPDTSDFTDALVVAGARLADLAEAASVQDRLDQVCLLRNTVDRIERAARRDAYEGVTS